VVYKPQTREKEAIAASKFHKMSRQADSHPDPFDTLLTLEDTLYTDAYALGTKDGARAGRIEGRIFGLEKGFEKFASMGVLHGRACVWASRLPSSPGSRQASSNLSEIRSDSQSTQEPELSPEVPTPRSSGSDSKSDSNPTSDISTSQNRKLPSLPQNSRIAKNIQTLHSLTDPLTFSTNNTEDSVADFDDRFKRAGAKARLISHSIGETAGGAAAEQGSGSESGSSSPRKKGGQVRRGVKVVGEGSRKGDGQSMEDFVGARGLR
jgi:hypothetical protein